MTIPSNLKSLYPLPKIYDHSISTAEAPGFERVEGETIPRRNSRTKDALQWQPKPEISTVYDVLKHAAKTYGNAKALGSRKLIRMHNESKKIKKVVDGQEVETEKKWQYFELGEYTYMSFIEFERLALQIGAG